MDPATILADVTVALNIGNLLLNAGEQAIPWFVQAYQIATGATVLTAAQRQANLAAEAQLTSELNTPSIPADQP